MYTIDSNDQLWAIFICIVLRENSLCIDLVYSLGTVYAMLGVYLVIVFIIFTRFALILFKDTFGTTGDTY